MNIKVKTRSVNFKKIIENCRKDNIKIVTFDVFNINKKTLRKFEFKLCDNGLVIFDLDKDNFMDSLKYYRDEYCISKIFNDYMYSILHLFKNEEYRIKVTRCSKLLKVMQTSYTFKCDNYYEEV